MGQEDGDSGDVGSRILRGYQEFGCAVHPVVRTHPVTGEKSLFVNKAFTTHIIGMGKPESHSLLTMLFEHLKKPEFAVRHRWTSGDIAVWDNWATQHYAVNDYSEYRRMRRCRILADASLSLSAAA